MKSLSQASSELKRTMDLRVSDRIRAKEGLAFWGMWWIVAHLRLQTASKVGRGLAKPGPVLIHWLGGTWADGGVRVGSPMNPRFCGCRASAFG